MRKTEAISLTCQIFTKTAQATAPENIDPERLLPAHVAQGTVLSSSRITLEYNEKIRPEPDRENAFARASGGGNESSKISAQSPAVIRWQNCTRTLVSKRLLIAFSRLRPVGTSQNGGADRRMDPRRR
jgi:hypothetical protein